MQIMYVGSGYKVGITYGTQYSRETSKGGGKHRDPDSINLVQYVSKLVTYSAAWAIQFHGDR